MQIEKPPFTSPALDRPCRTQEQVAIARLRRALEGMNKSATYLLAAAHKDGGGLLKGAEDRFVAAADAAREVLESTAHLDGGGQG